ncbi:SLATT domain-containing protein [Chitinolyticbacter meiyuanensis]|uniref:SLATT domain-containing protein n=1 Tax=Chitinolyticbacter meiyuanensis TaxID=682798 RepID=UPI0011E594F8|nr:SLATT domain-containing protein [Chitinolyticbacter meiyuanensis]
MDQVQHGLGALAALEELRRDARICKGRHFAAADRKLTLHRWCGVPVILANLFVGIVLVNLQGGNINLSGELDPASLALGGRAVDALSLISTLLAFCAASLSAVQTFFNFHKTAEGHRAIGNRYIDIARRAKNLLQKQADLPEDVGALWENYTALYEEYRRINVEAEAFPTSHRDLQLALAAPELTP